MINLNLSKLTLFHSNVIEFGRIMLNASKKLNPIRLVSNTFSNKSPICFNLKFLSKPKEHGNVSSNVPI